MAYDRARMIKLERLELKCLGRFLGLVPLVVIATENNQHRQKNLHRLLRKEELVAGKTEAAGPSTCEVPKAELPKVEVPKVEFLRLPNIEPLRDGPVKEKSLGICIPRERSFREVVPRKTAFPSTATNHERRTFSYLSLFLVITIRDIRHHVKIL
jgi:hypothetical protein